MYIQTSKMFPSVVNGYSKLLSRRSFQTSPRRDVGFLFAPIVRVAVAVGARLGRRWWVKLSPERKLLIRGSLYRSRHYWYAGVLGLSGAGGLYYWTHVEVTPITGRRRFIMFSNSDIVKLVEEEKDSLIQEMAGDSVVLPQDHPYTQFVCQVVGNIVSRNASPEFEGIDWQVMVVEKSNMVNAVCLPGGLVIVFTGLLEACRNNDEVAFILGHEIAHAVLAHGAEGLSHKGLVEGVSLFLVALVWAIIPSDLLAWFTHSAARSTAYVLLDYPYSRTLEAEADSVGLLFASRACYNPTRGVQVWSHLSSIDTEVQFLSTHPSNETRLATLTALLPTAVSVWEESKCAHTMAEATLFSSAVSKALKKTFPFLAT